MPVTGPTMSNAEYIIDKIIGSLYTKLVEYINNKRTNFVIFGLIDRLLDDNFGEVSGYDYTQHERTREKYLLAGFLIARFPNIEYTTEYPGGLATGLKIDPASLDNLDIFKLRTELVDLLFNLDCEDF